MKKAIQGVKSGKLSCKAAARSYDIPRSTLQRYIKKSVANPDIAAKIVKPGSFKPVFSQEQESELAEYLKGMEGRLFGLSSKEFRSLAYELAEKNGLRHNFDHETRMAGEDWLKYFLKRNPTVSLRKPEATSAARAQGFNRVSVNNFFDLLEQCIDKYKIKENKIFNVDETGITTVAKSLGKILASKGRKQVGSLSSAERGQLLTVEVCMGADGSFMPPMFIFPRERMKIELMNGTPPNSWGECNKKGWMTKELFLTWFKKFVQWSRAKKDDPVLLLLDGHVTHVKSIELIDYARDNGVVLLCFPPHCTHRLQPLDVSFMKPLSTYYSEEVKKWLRTHPGRTVTHYQVGELFGNAYLRAATMSVAINGFRKTGIWPVDRNIFVDVDFLPADVTDVPIEQDQSLTTDTPEDENESYSAKLPSNAHVNLDTLTTREKPSPPSTPPQMTPSASNPVTALPGSSTSLGSCSPIPCPSTSFNKFSPTQAFPFPKAPAKKRVSKRRGKTAIITSSLYKDELKAVSNDTVKKNVVKRKVHIDDTTVQKNLSTNNNNNKAKKLKRGYMQNTDSESEDDEECLYCGYLYSQSTEGWISCIKCGKWAHCPCAGEDDNDSESTHICAFCI
ncbi:uncharacterized protein LOC115881449 [Sitophilus oryzae]|uniref:Uncharacterized protein LOC115881449 n=1 Tax=Sitophilus oryzae TaxID=7048 RepID=A0A6J2XTD5_SITOR|nr:uncharacterized protein LOC115881449 [Sitophilus oryzae]